MTLQELTAEAQKIAAAYDQKNKRDGRPLWTTQDYVNGLVGDLGDLMKISQAKNGVRSGSDIEAKLTHELADCLWSLLLIADRYGVDMEVAFTDTMKELTKRLQIEPTDSSTNN